MSHEFPNPHQHDTEEVTDNPPDAPTQVQLTRTSLKARPSTALWWLIDKSTEALSFKRYAAHMDAILCGDQAAMRSILGRSAANATQQTERQFQSIQGRRFLPYTDTDGYRLLKTATEAFIMTYCGVKLEESDTAALLTRLGERTIDGSSIADASALYDEYLVQVNRGAEGSVGGERNDPSVLPYFAAIRQKLKDQRIKDNLFVGMDVGQEQRNSEEKCYGLLLQKMQYPCMVELIWSYWHEQGMLVQTMNAISRRFQNIRGPASRDPLAMMELDPLRALNNLLWGYLQDEQHRLTVLRRAYEYDHHYGLMLEGKAIPPMYTADSRSKFIEALHNLLNIAARFYKQDDDTTVRADAFPVLNALKDVHMLLSEGAHNQFGDLPVTARIEMLMQQWLLARPEFREVLPTRTMVAYPEPWMDRVDAMKRLQGWTDSSIMQFHNLGVFGEQVFLSARFGNWNDVQDPLEAAIWARYFRPQVQGYMHAYRSVTGVDLAADITQPQQRTLFTAQPSDLLKRRLPEVVSAPEPVNVLPGRAAPAQLPAGGFRQRRSERA